MSWEDRLRPASFRGVEFHVDTAAKSGGRRGITFEFPKRDDSLDEDMGRRARRRAVTAYFIGDDYDLDAQDLEDACEAEGPGLLVHPTMGQMQARCESYNRVETKTELRFCRFDMIFVEARNTSYASLMSEPTQANVNEKADAAEGAAETGSAAEKDWNNPRH